METNGLNLQSLHEQVYRYLRHEMHTGALFPGATIDIKRIARQLGVSSSPVRDALIQLEVEGFVSIFPRRGVKVKGLLLEDIENFYSIIGALEASVIESIFHKFDRAAVRSLEQFNAEYRKAISLDDSDAIYSKNLSFHGVFLNLSKNDELTRIIKPLKDRLYDFPRHAYIREWELRNADEHQKLIDCIKKGDSKAAARTWRDMHWSFRVQEDYIRKFYSLALEELRLCRQEHTKAYGIIG